MSGIGVRQRTNQVVGEALETLKLAQAQGRLNDLEVVNGRIQVASLGHRLVSHFLDHFRSADSKQQRIAEMHRTVLSQFLHSARESLGDFAHKQAFDMVMSGGELAPEEVREYKAQFEAGQIPDAAVLDRLLHRISVAIVSEDFAGIGQLQDLLEAVRSGEALADSANTLDALKGHQRRLERSVGEIQLRQRVLAAVRQQMDEHAASMPTEVMPGELLRHNEQLAVHLQRREQRSTELLKAVKQAMSEMVSAAGAPPHGYGFFKPPATPATPEAVVLEATPAPSEPPAAPVVLEATPAASEPPASAAAVDTAPPPPPPPPPPVQSVPSSAARQVEGRTPPLPPPRTSSLTEKSTKTASPQRSDMSESRAQNTDGRADLLQAIRIGKTLKSTKQVEHAPLKSDSPRDNILKEIREGKTLKSTKQVEHAPLKSDSPRDNFLKEIRAGRTLKPTTQAESAPAKLKVGEKFVLTEFFGKSLPATGPANAGRNENNRFGLFAVTIPKGLTDEHQNRPVSGSGDDDDGWAVDQKEGTLEDNKSAEEHRNNNLLLAKLAGHFKNQDPVRVAYQEATGVTLFMTREAYQDMVDPGKRKKLEATRALVHELKQQSASLRDAQWAVEIIESPKAPAPSTPVTKPMQQAPSTHGDRTPDSSQASAAKAVPPPPPLSANRYESAEDSPLESKSENDIKPSRSDLLAQIRVGKKLKARSSRTEVSAHTSKPEKSNELVQALKFPSGTKVSLSKYLAELASLENADTAVVRARRGAMTMSASRETRESESDDMGQERADEFARSIGDLVMKASGSKNSAESTEAVAVTVEETSSGSWTFLISISSKTNQRMHEKPAECRQLAIAINKSCDSNGFDFQDIAINIR